jgi:hypothetical protein
MRSYTMDKMTGANRVVTAIRETAKGRVYKVTEYIYSDHTRIFLDLPGRGYTTIEVASWVDAHNIATLELDKPSEKR